jgi:hypothetical protein
MRKLLSVLGILALITLLWYLFIKPYDYRVSFMANTTPGAINQTVKLWNATLKNSQPIEQVDLEHFTQRIAPGDSTYTYTWQVTQITDSTSRIRVYIRDVNHSLANKITIPFMETDFEKGAKKTLTELNTQLTEHLGEFKVTLAGQEEYADAFCAYVSLKGIQREKAAGMMRNYPLFSSIFAASNVEVSGLPFIEITRWDQQTDSIAYNFCYPIIQSDSLPVHPDIKYKKFSGKKALKAIYNGNYITSDRAWYVLQEYAKKNHIEVTPLPVEFFYTNPNMGGDALRWKAEIYMPLK